MEERDFVLTGCRGQLSEQDMKKLILMIVPLFTLARLPAFCCHWQQAYKAYCKERSEKYLSALTNYRHLLFKNMKIIH